MYRVHMISGMHCLRCKSLWKHYSVKFMLMFDRENSNDGNDIHTKDSNSLQNCRTWAILKFSQSKWIHTRLRTTPIGGDRIKRLLTKALLKRRLFENHEYGQRDSFFSKIFMHFAPCSLVKNTRSPANHVYEINKRMNSRLQWTGFKHTFCISELYIFPCLLIS